MQFEFSRFKDFIPKIHENDIRPIIRDETRKYLNTKPFDPNSYKTQAQQFLEDIWHEHKILPRRFVNVGKHINTGDGLKDYYETLIWDWGHHIRSRRRHRFLAWAAFYYFFRFVSDVSYFVSIAEQTWDHDSEEFMRFVYAKCGGTSADSFEKILERYFADISDVKSGLKKCWVSPSTQIVANKPASLKPSKRVSNEPKENDEKAPSAYFGRNYDFVSIKQS